MPLTQQVPPVARGYHYALQVGVSSDDAGPFPAGAVIVAQLRDYAGGNLAGELSTADGTLFRVDDHHLEIQAPASLTARLGNTSASIDFVRTDQGELEWLAIGLKLPVLLPTTQLGTTALSGMGMASGATTAIIISDRQVTLQRCAIRATTATINVAPLAIVSGASVPVPSITKVAGLAIGPAAIGPGVTVPAPALAVASGQQIGPAVIAASSVVRAPTVKTGGTQSNVTIDDAVTRAGQTYTFTARRDRTAGAETRTIKLVPSTAYTPAATANDLSGVPSASANFADGAATAPVSFTVPATVQPE